jgi:hypothetical protein
MPGIGLARAVLGIVLAAAPPLAAQQPPLWGGLKGGRHAVGYRQVSLAEGTLHVWFPAAAQQGERLRVGEYFGREGGGPLPARLLQAPSAAFPQAVAAGGSFPLILYAGDPGSAGPDNTVLAEYLASHGYVVATVPGTGGGLEVALAALAGHAYVSRDAIAVVARGRGWLPAIEFAAARPAVRAVLGLDPPPTAPAAVAPGRTLAVLRFRCDASGLASPAAPSPPGSAGVTVTVPRSTRDSFGDRAAWLGFLGRPDDAAPDHRRLIASVAHAFLDGALRAWGPSLEDLAARLSRAGLAVDGHQRQESRDSVGDGRRRIDE